MQDGKSSPGCWKMNACTGGMHRSVCMAEAMYKHLRDNGVDVSIEHRDIQKNDVEEDAPGYEGEA